MAVDLEKLTVSLEANLKSFEKAMAKANAISVRELRAMEKNTTASMSRIEKTMGGVGSSLNGLLAGALAGFSVEALGRAIKSVADLADTAESLGIKASALQAIEFVGRQNGVEADKLTGALQKLNLEVGEAQTKGNDLKKIFDLNSVQFSPDALVNFRTVADLIKNARSEQDKSVIGAAAFGKAYAGLIPLLNQGAAAIGDGEEKARSAGGVISDELVAKAREFDDAWTFTWDVWSAQGKAAVIGVAAQLENLYNDPRFKRLADTVLAGGNAFQQKLEEGRNPFDRQFFFGGADTNSRASLESEMLAVAQKRKDLEQQIEQLQSSGRPPIEIDEYRARLDEANASAAELQARIAALPASLPASSVRKSPEGGTYASSPPSAFRPTVVPNAQAERDAAAATSAKASADKVAKVAAESRAEQIRRVIEGLQFEGDQLKTNSLQQKINSELRSAGVSATSAQGQEIAALVTQNYNLEASQRLVNLATENYATQLSEIRDGQMEMARMGVDAFNRMAISGENVTDVLVSLADQLAEAAVNAALLGSGPMAALFGTSSSGGLIGSLLGGGASSFAGLYANGGQIPSGKIGIAGEAGPELIRGPANVIPMNRMTGGGGTHVTIVQNISANGDKAVADIAYAQTQRALRDVEMKRPQADVERRLRTQ